MSAGVRRILKRVALVVGGLVALAAVAYVVAFHTSALMGDLSAEGLGTPADGQQQQKRMQDAHGGLEAWLDRSWVELKLDGNVPGFSVQMGFGISTDAPGLTLRFDPCDRQPMTARVDDAGDIAEFSADAAEGGHRLMVLAIRHLYEMPFAMRSADVVHGMPPADGADRVFMSWGQAGPQMDTDQYVLRLGEDGRLTGFASTVRVIAPFVMADAIYTEYVQREGLSLPKQVAVHQGPGGPLVHSWTLTELTLGPPRSPADRCM